MDFLRLPYLHTRQPKKVQQESTSSQWTLVAEVKYMYLSSSDNGLSLIEVMDGMDGVDGNDV